MGLLIDLSRDNQYDQVRCVNVCGVYDPWGAGWACLKHISRGLQDLSDSENIDIEEGRFPGMRFPPRRTSYDVSRTVKEQAPPYRRSHSLAELQAEREREKLALQHEAAARPVSGSRATERRSTLSSLVFSSLAAFDQTGNAVIPPYVKKKQKRQGVIGLPDTPVALTEINLEDLLPRYAPPIKPTGKLKLQLLFSTDRISLTVIIIEAQGLIIPGVPTDVEVNPYVKAFLVPGRTFKYRTKTLRNTRDPLFLEKFIIKDLSVPGDDSEEPAIEFQVYSSHHVSRRHLVGVASIRLADVDKLSSGQVELLVTPQTVYRMHQGDLRVSGCYQPVAGKIVFNILEARNLPRVSLLGAINPYVKVEMYVNGIREGKNKCKVRQNTQDPVWHHQVIFEVNRENPKLLGHVFVFHVLHKDMMTGVHKIGQVDLGWYSHGEQLEHWYEIMEHPHRSTDHWHPIIKTGKITS
ncbi:synaptotagmin-1 [Aplysia californica]|uniref:Synaptotagmin-1 n=1 Tax=Aplysia californica TaxID=6500 RepID=A0ABM1VVZ0_APLCA|nr:synaptotagmin-1 [Aplysia californica]